MGLRRWLYAAAKLAGDYEAVKKGKVSRRIGRRFVGRATGRALGRIFK
jgi:hypothetical protein